MFEQLDEPRHKGSDEEQYPDDTGLKLLGILIPVFLIFIFFGHREMGLTFVLVLGMVLLAIKLQWRLRKHAWFWTTVAVVLALHIPLFLLIRWPETKAPISALAFPFAVLDFLIVSGVLRVAANLFLKHSSSDEEQ